MPRTVAFSLAWSLMRASRPDMAAFTVLLFEAYLRPSEGLCLRGLQIVAPAPEVGDKLRFHTVMIHAREWDRPGKTHVFDHTVTLELPRHRWLGALLYTIARGRGRHRLLWDFTYAEYLGAFRRAARDFRLDGLALCPYMLRHGGASHDRAAGERSLGEVQARGNWRSFESVRRYDKHARLGEVLARVPPARRRELAALEAALPGALTACWCRSSGAPKG